MMDARTQARMAADLGATGWWWSRPRTDGSGNVKRLDPVSWEAIIGRLMKDGYTPCGTGHVARIVGSIGPDGVVRDSTDPAQMTLVDPEGA